MAQLDNKHTRQPSDSRIYTEGRFRGSQRSYRLKDSKSKSKWSKNILDVQKFLIGLEGPGSLRGQNVSESPRGQRCFQAEGEKGPEGPEIPGVPTGQEVQTPEPFILEKAELAQMVQRAKSLGPRRLFRSR